MTVKGIWDIKISCYFCSRRLGRGHWGFKWSWWVSSGCSERDIPGKNLHEVFDSTAECRVGHWKNPVLFPLPSILPHSSSFFSCLCSPYLHYKQGWFPIFLQQVNYNFIPHPFLCLGMSSTSWKLRWEFLGLSWFGGCLRSLPILGIFIWNGRWLISEKSCIFLSLWCHSANALNSTRRRGGKFEGFWPSHAGSRFRGCASGVWTLPRIEKFHHGHSATLTLQRRIPGKGARTDSTATFWRECTGTSQWRRSGTSGPSYPCSYGMLG